MNHMTINTPDAPWNQKDRQEKTINVTVSITMSKTFTIKTDNYEIVDYGTTQKESVDYTDYAFRIGEAVTNKEVDYGIVICGTGIGISIACNKVKGVRCAKVDNVRQAKLTRIDNDANIIALDGSMRTYKVLDIIDAYLNTPYSNLEKHNRRLQKIESYENKIYIIPATYVNGNPIAYKL